MMYTEINSLFAESLEKLKNLRCENENYSEKSPTLLYPQRFVKNPSDKHTEKRISEQEAKMLFCNLLLEKGKYFSLETPTKKSYQFTGNSSRSGNVDVCVYEVENNKYKYKRTNCIEFKAHNQENFDSDMEKLLREEGDNYFVHILPHINSGTLYRPDLTNRKGVINKYIEAIAKVKERNPEELLFNSLTFCIFILEPFCVLFNQIDSLDDFETKLILQAVVKHGKIEENDVNWKQWN